MGKASLFTFLTFLMASTAFADNIDERFQPLVEIAYKLRLFEGALNGQMPVDTKAVETTLNLLDLALHAIQREREETIPLVGRTHGPNKIVVSRLEEISKRMGRVVRGVNTKPLIDKSKELREELKNLLVDAHKYSRNNSAPKPERELSDQARDTITKLKALADDPQLTPLLYDANARAKILMAKVMVGLLPIIPLAGAPNLDDLYDIVDEFENFVVTYNKDSRIVEHARLLIYDYIVERLFTDNKKRILAGPVILPDGAQLLLQDLRARGVIPNALDVTVVPDFQDLKGALAGKLKSPDPKRFFLIAYYQNHASLIYVDSIAGPTRALIVDATGAATYAAMFAARVKEVVDQLGIPIYMVATPRQADDMSCVSFVLEDLVTLANEPDIFARLKADEPSPEREFTLLDCSDPKLGIATQMLSKLPNEALKGCIVKRKGFSREERADFIKRHTYVRLVHDSELAARVDKAQYLAMEKRAASNRVKVLKLYLGRKKI